MFIKLKELGPLRSTYLLIAINFIAHLLIMGRFELSADEAHYALYAHFLDWSYFDHPPLAGWLQYVALQFSDSELSLRLWALLLSSWAIFLVYKITLEWFPEENQWLGFVSATVVATMPLYQLLSIAVIPETLLLVWGLVVALWTTRILNTPSIKNWLILGLLLGLAGLSKYTAITLIISLVIIVLVERKWVYFKSYKLWLAVLLAFVMVLPVLYWNYSNDWISFRFQMHRTGTSEEWGAAQLWSMKTFLTAQIGQMLSYGPLVYVAGWILLLKGLMDFQHRGTLLTLAFALPLLVLINLNAGYYPNPYWVVFAWVISTPLIMRWLLHSWHKTSVRIISYTSILYTLLVLILIYGQLGLNMFSFPKGQNPFAEFHGWEQAANHAIKLRENLPDDERIGASLFMGNWTITSRLAWYARPYPVVVIDKWQDQFDLWYGSPVENAHGIFVEWSMYAYPPVVGNRSGQFQSCQHLDKMEVVISGEVGAYYDFYYCKGYHS